MALRQAPFLCPMGLGFGKGQTWKHFGGLRTAGFPEFLGSLLAKWLTVLLSLCVPDYLDKRSGFPRLAGAEQSLSPWTPSRAQRWVREGLQLGQARGHSCCCCAGQAGLLPLLDRLYPLPPVRLPGLPRPLPFQPPGMALGPYLAGMGGGKAVSYQAW